MLHFGSGCRADNLICFAPMVDYSIYYRTTLPLGDPRAQDSWDLFLSAFNSSERVSSVYRRVTAGRKDWLVFPEYEYRKSEWPKGRCFTQPAGNESEFIQNFFSSVPLDLGRASICIDITGFIRPHLIFLTKFLFSVGVKRFDVLYSEPVSYRKKELTQFSCGGAGEVRQVAGYEGVHSTHTSHDLLIIGSGYDSDLIVRVANHKESAKKIQVLGLPSLRADFYQQNELRAALAEEAVGEAPVHFASASDPFSTAALLREIVRVNSRQNPITNLYLAPLGTKVQVLGFCLFYLFERENTACSIIFPFAPRYDRETTVGLSRVWKYTVEAPLVSGRRSRRRI